jgi:hypothetical protein
MKKRLRRAARKTSCSRQTRNNPQWDPDLPRNRIEIEQQMNELLKEQGHELASQEPAVFLPDGSKQVKMGPAMQKLMRLQFQLFRAVFNREPGPHDPVFWDHDRESEGPVPIDHNKWRRELGKDMRTAGIRPAMAYAVEKTGMIITTTNKHLFTDAQLQEWDDAVEEYESTN